MIREKTQSNILSYTAILTIFLMVSILAAGCTSSTPPEPMSTETPEGGNPTEKANEEEKLAGQIATWEAEKAANPTATPTEIPTITPTEADKPTESPTQTASPPPNPDDWKEAPVVPLSVSEQAIEIYQQGLELGNDPHAFSKVGDCGGTPSWFLGSFDYGPEYYSLGDHDYLSAMIEHYQGSFKRYSIAVSPGFNTASVFAPLWADPEKCESGEGPLECELRVHNPSVVLIMLGTNDQYHADEFEEPMREIIEFSIEHGVVPILASKADNLEGDDSINRTIYKLSLEYELPFWNFWRAMQELPNQGLQEDDAHLTWAPNFFDDEKVMKTAWPIRNLTALQSLNTVWSAMPAPPEETP